MILLRIFVLSALCAALQVFFPWWAMPIAAFVLGAAFGQRVFSSFLMGFFAIALLWGGYAFYLHLGNEGILSGRIAQLFQVDMLGAYVGLSKAISMVLFTGLFGGILAGLSSLSGAWFRQLFHA